MQDSKSAPTLSLQQMSIEAKRRHKLNQIKHSVALEQIARESGYTSYHHAQQVLSRGFDLGSTTTPVVARTPTRQYRPMPFARAATRPLKVVELETHRAMASIIYDVMHFSEDRLRPSVREPLDSLRCSLDDWVEYEHRDEEAFTLEVRSAVYYTHRPLADRVVFNFRDISANECDELCSKLDKLAHLLLSSYGECDPIDDALVLVNRAKSNVKKWLGASVARAKRRESLHLPAPTQKVRSYDEWSALGRPRKDRRPQEPEQVEDISRSFSSPLEIVQNAIRLVKLHLTERDGRIPRRLPEYLSLRRDLPYVLQSMSAPGIVLVNRDYKPCGHPKCRDWVQYEDYKAHHASLSESQVLGVVEPGRAAGLFGDGSAPWHYKRDARKYLKRLERLATLLETRSQLL